MEDNELKHYGVPGMKWGHRKSNFGRGDGLAGMIRRRQMNNAIKTINKNKMAQKQINSELKELKSYARNPQGLAKSRISTAIRNRQIKSLQNKNSKLNASNKDNNDAIKELKDIEKYRKKQKATKKANKAAKKIAQQKVKDLKVKYKDAYKQYSKDFNKSSSLLGAYGPGNKERHNNTYNSALKANKAYEAYKKAKKELKRR